MKVVKKLSKNFLRIKNKTSTNNPIKKLAKDLNRPFSKKDNINGQQVHVKMLNITNH